MNIAVIGIGLMGGSLCKAIKKHTTHSIFGIDTDPHTIARALESGAIDDEITPEQLGGCDLCMICLGPEAIIDFVCAHAHQFKKSGTVIDICGVKAAIVQALEPVLEENGVHYVGTHPMAGREYSGFAYADESIFQNASFIITPTQNTSPDALEQVRSLAKSMGFGKIVLAAPTEHDKNIAFTSQLAHVVSNAYIKSPSLWNESGFSAGSFLDLTRVAKLNEEMWSSLFLLNQTALLGELDTLIGNLTKYKTALENHDRKTLKNLLKEGRILKEKSLMGDKEEENKE